LPSFASPRRRLTVRCAKKVAVWDEQSGRLMRNAADRERFTAR
jgi:hypothetical protein